MGLRVIEVVSIPVSDVDRAQVFYADTLGFTLDIDNPIGDGMRWVQLTPPSGGASIALITWNADVLPPGAIKELYLACDDIEGTVAALADRGVQFTQPVFDTPFGKFARFNDPDGNGWQLHQGP
jgi:predicted enzyme related to lactoylglutathione lyase